MRSNVQRKFSIEVRMVQNSPPSQPHSPLYVSLISPFELTFLSYSTSIVCRRGFSFVKVEPFREMCEQAVNRQKKPQARMDEACKVAQTFSMVSYAYGYFLTLPSECSE